MEFAGGKVSNNSPSRYPVPRFADMPPIESVVLNRKDLTSTGAGECPIIGIAPAVGNAIFDATGQRVRSLPRGAPAGVTVGRAIVFCDLPTRTTKNDRLRHQS